jgi:hypothetical protein
MAVGSRGVDQSVGHAIVRRRPNLEHLAVQHVWSTIRLVRVGKPRLQPSELQLQRSIRPEWRYQQLVSELPLRPSVRFSRRFLGLPKHRAHWPKLRRRADTGCDRKLFLHVYSTRYRLSFCVVHIERHYWFREQLFQSEFEQLEYRRQPQLADSSLARNERPI